MNGYQHLEYFILTSVYNKVFLQNVYPYIMSVNLAQAVMFNTTTIYSTSSNTHFIYLVCAYHLQVSVTRKGHPYGKCVDLKKDNSEVNVYEELYPVKYSAKARPLTFSGSVFTYMHMHSMT